MTRKESRIKIIGASAGTGKTTRLANEFVASVNGKNGKKVPADKILVSSFTTKASAELIGRIRQRLIQEKNPEAAQLVFSGYVGTVNSICGQILADNALAAGLSPSQNVIPEDLEQIVFSIAADSVFDAYSDKLDELAARLSFNEPPRRSRFATSIHWTEFVKQVCHYARTNAISADELPSFAEKSWNSMKVFLRTAKPGVKAEDLDAKLLKELERSVNSLRRANDSTKKTQETIQRLEEILARSKRQSLTWADWAILAGTDVSKASSIMILGLVNTSNDHPAHPGLHRDLEDFIVTIFQCAADALKAYQEYKTNAGLLDFADQEYRVLSLLNHPDVQDSIRSKVQLAFIDEFQDTSPIQLSLFLKLSELIEESVWVGDPKQAIYGFRGSDPALMESASKLFSFDHSEQLKKSFRSKRPLVEFSNNVFEQAFTAFGHDADSITIEATRDDLDDTPAIEVWRCDGAKLDICYRALATGVLNLLSRSPSAQIFDKKLNVLRPLKGSDIAILCRSNDRCQGVVEALSNQNLRVAMTRDGLLETPECLLAVASMRYLIDKSDRYALALITNLLNDYTHHTQDKWLTDWLSAVDHPETLLQYESEFENARAKILPNCTALEALQAGMTAGHVIETACSWGNLRQRTANLDALRGLAQEYEEECSLERSAASAAGFIAFVEHLKNSKQPASASSDAVQVLTYHASKGLEWPVVILTDLDKGAKPEVHKDICRVSVEASAQEFDSSKPLAGRWIRFWPWPYGRQEQNVYLDASILKSTEYETTYRRLKAESVRLLYVGITRARDLLILAPYVNRRGQSSSTDWLDHLENAAKRRVLRLPHEDGLSSLAIADSTHTVMTQTLSGELENAHKSIYEPETIFLSERRSSQFPALLVKPSQALLDSTVDPTTLRVFDLGERIPLTGTPDMQLLGECVHRFMAADLPHLTFEQRMEIAERLRLAWTVSNVSPESMLEMSDRFRIHIQETWGDCTWYRESPITARIKNQRITGIIDLILETTRDFVIYDHKSFPGGPDAWANKALSFAGQLKMYADAMSQATNSSVQNVLIHMPLVGKVIDLTPAITPRD